MGKVGSFMRHTTEWEALGEHWPLNCPRSCDGEGGVASLARELYLDTYGELPAGVCRK